MKNKLNKMKYFIIQYNIRKYEILQYKIKQNKN